jgi:hypothetical protein
MPELEISEPEGVVTKRVTIGCIIEGCLTHHDPYLQVDGVDVATAYCQDHANDHFRSLWAVEGEEDDPRLPENRYAPWACRATMRDPVLYALSQRKDIKPCPDEGRTQLPWSDARSAMTKVG